MTLRNSLSIFILTAATAFVMPSQLPSAENGYSFSASAEAANIKAGRTRMKKRSNGLYKSVVKTSNDIEDTEVTSAVTSDITYIDPLGNLQPLETVTMNSPKKMRAEYVWTPPEGFTPGEVNLTCCDGGQTFDTSVDLSLVPENGDFTSFDMEGANTEVQIKLKDNGKYKLDIVGKTADMEAFTGETPQVLQVNGEAAKYKHTERIWKGNLSSDITEETLDGATYFTDVAAYNELGEIQDKSTVSGFVGDEDAIRSTESIDSIEINKYSEFTALDIFQYSDAVDTEQTLSTVLTDLKTGEKYGEATDKCPGGFSLGFAQENLEFVEYSNVTDHNYYLTIDFLDIKGNSLGEIQGIIEAREAIDIPDEFTNFGDDQWTANGIIVQDESIDSEYFYIFISVAGTQIEQLSSIVATVEQEDSGSDLDTGNGVLNLNPSEKLSVWSYVLDPSVEKLLLNNTPLIVGNDLSTNGKLQDRNLGTVNTIPGTVHNTKTARKRGCCPRRSMKTVLVMPCCPDYLKR